MYFLHVGHHATVRCHLSGKGLGASVLYHLPALLRLFPVHVRNAGITAMAFDARPPGGSSQDSGAHGHGKWQTVSGGCAS